MSNTPRTGPVHRERWHEVREAVQDSVVLRLADTVIGVAVGVAAAWLELRAAALWPRTAPGVKPASEPQRPAG